MTLICALAWVIRHLTSQSGAFHLRQHIMACSMPFWQVTAGSVLCRQGRWVEPAWQLAYCLAAAGLAYGLLRMPLAQQVCVCAAPASACGIFQATKCFSDQTSTRRCSQRTSRASWTYCIQSFLDLLHSSQCMMGKCAACIADQVVLSHVGYESSWHACAGRMSEPHANRLPSHINMLTCRPCRCLCWHGPWLPPAASCCGAMASLHGRICKVAWFWGHSATTPSGTLSPFSDRCASL